MTKRHIEPIARGRVRLRLLASADLPMTLAWRNQPHIRQWFINSNPLTAEQHRDWFEHYARCDNDFVFIIEETKELLKAVGQIALYDIDWGARSAEFGRILVGEPDAAGRGLAKEATALVLDYAFRQLGLEEVVSRIMSDNAASLAVCLSSGFREAEEHDGMKIIVAHASPLTPD